MYLTNHNKHSLFNNFLNKMEPRAHVILDAIMSPFMEMCPVFQNKENDKHQISLIILLYEACDF